jgi:hypothetical protein
MGNTTKLNPYWEKALQYQQGQQQGKTQVKQQQQRQQPQGKAQVKEGFDPDLVDKDVEIEQVKGQNVVVIRGRVIDVSKYWLKLLANGETLYLNKAFILSIKPVVIKNTVGGANAGNGK